MKRTLVLCLFILSAFSGRMAAAQSPQVHFSVNRVTAPVDESNRVQLRGNVFPLARTIYDRGPAPLSQPTGRITLVLQRSAAQQQALTQYLSDLQNPASASYHKWLTPAQYGAQFGISDADLQTVESWLERQGFAIEQIPQARNFIQFSGTFAQVQAAFHTSIHSFSIRGETHFANVTNPQIPAALAPVLAGVGPLNDFHPQPTLKMGATGHWDPAARTIQPDLTLQSAGGPLLFVDPADAATIYDTPNRNLNPNYSGGTLDGSGVNIGVVGNSNITMQDVLNYRTAFLGETATSANLPTVVVDGNDPGINSSGVEALLDNEVAGGLAPRAKIYFYTSAGSDLSDGLFDAMLRAIDDNTVSILSISFTSCEASVGSSGNAFLLEAMQQAAAQGMSVVVSAGDGGSDGCDNFDTATLASSGLGVNAFASTPYGIAVGGTDYDALPGAFSTYAISTMGTAPYYRTAKSYIPEEPWNDSTTQNGLLSQNIASTDSNGNTNIVGGGGGASSVYAKPPFQTGLTPADSHRDLPDVSLLAGNGYYSALWVLCSDSGTNGTTGSAVTDCQNNNGQFDASTVFDGVGGTSAAAPAFAGILALVEQSQGGARLGQADFVLYQLAQSHPGVFHDVTTGNNSVPCATGTPNCGSNGFLTGYDAKAGYDQASGLGSVDAAALVNHWSNTSFTPTSTTFQINGSTSYSGQHGASLSFGVGVSPAPAASGEAVAIQDDANQTPGGTSAGPQNNGQFTVPITGGTGTANWNGLPGGTYSVTARYGGDTSYAASTSAPIQVTITPENSITTLSVNDYNALTNSPVGTGNIPYGSFVVADAQIAGKNEPTNTQGQATGTVTFLNGTVQVGSGAVGRGNQASWPANNAGYTALAPGSYSLSADYSGDASFNPSSSAAVPFTVAKGITTVAASASPASISGTQSATVTVTFSTPENLGSIPAGRVTLTANGSMVGSISSFSQSVSGSGSAATWVLTGHASVYAGSLVAGTNVVNVGYSGDANYAPASTTVNISDSNGVGSFSLSNSGNLSLIAGQSSTSTVTVTPSGGFANTVALVCVPSGPVSCNPSASTVTVTGTAAVSAPAFTISAPFGAAPGTYAVTVHGTDSTGKVTASTAWNVTIAALPAGAGFTLANSGGLTVAPGTSGNATITIMPANGYIGVVKLSCAVTTSMGSVSGAPTCSIPPAETINGASGVSATLVVSSAASTSMGAYSVTVTGTDENSASITGSTVVPLTVQETAAIALGNGGGITLMPGATTGNSTTITVTPSGGFTGMVNLSCSVTTTIVQPNGFPTCSIPASVSVSGGAAVTVTLTVNTTAGTSSALASPLQRFFLGGAGATLALVLFVGIPARRRAWRALFSLVALAAITGAVGCGSSSGGGGTGTTGTTPGPYSVTVTGTDATGKITAATTVSLMVN